MSEVSSYELTSAQCAEIHHRLLEGAWECPWCNVQLRGRGGVATGNLHGADCLLAEITEEPRKEATRCQARACTRPGVGGTGIYCIDHVGKSVPA